MTDETKYMTTREYADAAGLTVDQVTRMLRDGSLAGEKVGGRWRIPAGGAPPASTPADAPAPQAATEGEARGGYGVEDFAAMTYLTAQGVRLWLRQGRLKGRVDGAGDWRVDAACLEDPDVKRLVR